MWPGFKLSDINKKHDFDVDRRQESFANQFQLSKKVNDL